MRSFGNNCIPTPDDTPPRPSIKHTKVMEELSRVSNLVVTVTSAIVVCVGLGYIFLYQAVSNLLTWYGGPFGWSAAYLLTLVWGGSLLIWGLKAPPKTVLFIVVTMMSVVPWFVLTNALIQLGDDMQVRFYRNNILAFLRNATGGELPPKLDPETCGRSRANMNQGGTCWTSLAEIDDFYHVRLKTWTRSESSENGNSWVEYKLRGRTLLLSGDDKSTEISPDPLPY